MAHYRLLQKTILTPRSLQCGTSYKRVQCLAEEQQPAPGKSHFSPSTSSRKRSSNSAFGHSSDENPEEMSQFKRLVMVHRKARSSISSRRSQLFRKPNDEEWTNSGQSLRELRKAQDSNNQASEDIFGNLLYRGSVPLSPNITSRNECIDTLDVDVLTSDSVRQNPPHPETAELLLSFGASSMTSLFDIFFEGPNEWNTDNRAENFLGGNSHVARIGV